MVNKAAAAHPYYYNKLCFERHDDPFASHSQSSWFPKYLKCFTLFGCLFPVILVLVGYGWHDNTSAGAAAAAPHLFVLVVQIIMETLSRRYQWHGYIMTLVPIGFSIYREFTLATWVQESYQVLLVTDNTTSNSMDSVLSMISFGLAVVNIVLWSYNCFIFLLLRMMPVYIDQERYPMPNVEWDVIGGLLPVIRHDDDDSKTAKSNKEE
jgi:hypothetical protein